MVVHSLYTLWSFSYEMGDLNQFSDAFQHPLVSQLHSFIMSLIYLHNVMKKERQTHFCKMQKETPANLSFFSSQTLSGSKCTDF